MYVWNSGRICGINSLVMQNAILTDSGLQKVPSVAYLKVRHPFHPIPSLMLVAAALLVSGRSDLPGQLQKLHQHHFQRMVYAEALHHFRHPNPAMGRGNRANFFCSYHHSAWRVPRKNCAVAVASNCPGLQSPCPSYPFYFALRPGGRQLRRLRKSTNVDISLVW